MSKNIALLAPALKENALLKDQKAIKDVQIRGLQAEIDRLKERANFVPAFVKSETTDMLAKAREENERLKGKLSAIQSIMDRFGRMEISDSRACDWIEVVLRKDGES